MIITTKYLGPTNYKAGRVKASMRQSDGTIRTATLEWDHGLNVERNHIAAMRALLAKWDAAHLEYADLRLTNWALHCDHEGGYVFMSYYETEVFVA